MPLQDYLKSETSWENDSDPANRVIVFAAILRLSEWHEYISRRRKADANY